MDCRRCGTQMRKGTPLSDVKSTKASRECAQTLVQRLEEILVSPDAVPLEDLPKFLLALASIQTTVSARLLTARCPVTPEPDPTPDRR